MSRSYGPRKSLFIKVCPVLASATLSLLCGCRAKPLQHEAEKTQVVSPPSDLAEVVDQGCPHQKNGVSCGHGDEAPSKSDNERSLYGAAFAHLDVPEVNLSQLLASPEEYHKKQVIVSGHVQRACSRRGCWMEISPTPNEASGCRVTFKDYAFLVPTNSQGSTAKLAGEVQVTKIERAAVEHYESEGGTFKDKRADGTAREVRIVATGVELFRASE